VLGSSAPDQLLYEERDEVFNLELGKTGDQRYITLLSTSKNSNETRVLDADQPNARPRRLLARRAGLEYGTEHHGAHFYLRINDRGANFRLVRMPEAAPSLAQAQELLPQRPGVSLEGLHAFKRHLVLLERERGLQQLRVLELDSGASHLVSFDEPAYSLAIADNDNDAFDTSLLRFRYSALGTPETVIDYDMAARTREVRKVAAVGGGFDAERYRSERIEVRAADGALVPVSLFYRRDLRRDGAQPLLLYGYGSYGMSMDPALLGPAPVAGGPRRHLCHCPCARRRRAGPGLVCGWPHGQEDEQLHRFHRRGRGAGGTRLHAAAAAESSKAAAPADC
jgi:oligopeptidase B